MQQQVMEPSRVTNILDLVKTSDENMVQNVSVGVQFKTSDHQAFTIMGISHAANPGSQSLCKKTQLLYGRLRISVLIFSKY